MQMLPGPKASRVSIPSHFFVQAELINFGFWPCRDMNRTFVVEPEKWQHTYCTKPENRGRETMTNACEHLKEIKEVTPSADGCEDCLKIGDDWVHLRLCLTCGHVGCCDSSKNKHATRHFHQVKHPIIKSFEPGEDWGWCYVDELFYEQMP